MKINGRELFNISRLEEYSSKFEDRAKEIENKMNMLEAEITAIDEQLEKAQIEDVLTGSTTTRKNLNNLQARRENTVSQYNQEKVNAEKLRELMRKGLTEIIPEISKQIAEDKQTYFNNVEKEIYKQLAEIRDKQAELLLTLELARKTAFNELCEYDFYCTTFGFEPAGIGFSHQDPKMPNSSCPEYGAPLLNLTSISAIEEVLTRSRANANAVYNTNRERMGLENEQLPPAKTFADIDLQAFLDSLK